MPDKKKRNGQFALLDRILHRTPSPLPTEISNGSGNLATLDSSRNILNSSPILSSALSLSRTLMSPGSPSALAAAQLIGTPPLTRETSPAGSITSGGSLKSSASITTATTSRLPVKEVSSNQEIDGPPSSSIHRSSTPLSVPISESLWKEALGNLSPSDRELLPGSHGEDIIQSIMDGMAKQKELCERNAREFEWRGEVYRSSDIADKIVSWIQTFVQVGDTIVQFDPVHAALPWAGFRFILQTAVNRKEAMGVSILGMERIANIIARTSVFEALYLGSEPFSAIQTNLRTQLVHLYAEILGFLAVVKKQIDQGGASRILSAIFENGETKERLQLLEQSALSVRTTASTVDAQSRHIRDQRLEDGINNGRSQLAGLREMLTSLNAPLSNVARQVDVLYTSLAVTRRREILMWLSPIEYQSHHREIHKGLVENTGQWLFDHSDFRYWRESPESSVLWLHGAPGAGKTRLTSAVVEQLTRKPIGATLDRGPISYFYCTRTEENRRKPEIILGTLMKQLAISTIHLPAGLVSNYDLRERDGLQGALNCDECQNLLVDIIKISQPPILVIDALDEMEVSGRSELLKAMKFILSHSTPVVRIFISSRMSEDIPLALTGVPRITIRARDNQTDIDKFITREIDTAIEEKHLLGGSISPDLKSKIVEVLSSKADGMFQWVALQIPYICEFQIAEDLEENLGCLPDTLQQSYDLLYDRIECLPGSSPILVKRALMWIICSMMPLSSEAWVEAVEWSAKLDGWSGWGFDHLLKLCRNLVVLDEELGVLRFAHLSVREFLVEKRFSEVEGHHIIGECCAAYFIRGAIDGFQAAVRQLHIYAFRMWIIHVQKGGHKDIDKYRYVIDFVTSPGHHGAWVDHYRTKIKTFRPSESHSSPSDQHLLLPWEDSTYQNNYDQCLWYDQATTRRHCLFAFALLGIPIIDQDLPSNAAMLREFDTHGDTLLAIASQYGHLQLVATLLTDGGEITLSVLHKSIQLALEFEQQATVNMIAKYLASKGYPILNKHRALYLFQKGPLSQVSALQSVSEFEPTEEILRAAIHRESSGYSSLITSFVFDSCATAITNEVLLMATSKLTVSTLRFLLIRKGNVKLTGALLMAAMRRSTRGSDDPDIVMLLMETTKIHNISRECLSVAVLAGDLDLFQRLIDKEITYANDPIFYTSLLIDALLGGNSEVLDAVKGLGVSITTATNVHGWTYDQVSTLMLPSWKCRLPGFDANAPDFTSILHPSGLEALSCSVEISGIELKTLQDIYWLVTVRSEQPVPPHLEEYYFEVEALEPFWASSQIPVLRLLEDYEYCVYPPELAKTDKTGFPVKYKKGDIFGLNWEIVTNDLRFMVNGELIKVYPGPAMGTPRRVYPGISFNPRGRVVRLKANFGGPFRYPRTGAIDKRPDAPTNPGSRVALRERLSTPISDYGDSGEEDSNESDSDEDF